MSAVSQSDPHHTGCALVVGVSPHRGNVLSAVEALGFSPGEADDPYSAMAELCQNPDGYDAVVLSLHGLHREELQIIPGIKTHFPRVEVWLADIEGRSAALAEAMRLGADGLLSEDGLHRIGDSQSTP